MKTIVQCFMMIGLISINSLKGQNDEELINRPKHEINVGFSNLLNKNDQPTYSYPPYYLSTVDRADYYAPYYYEDPMIPVKTKFGLGYKFHFGMNAARFSFGIGSSEKKTTYNYQGNNSSTQKQSKQTMAYRIGFERTLVRKNKLDLYLAAQFQFQQSDNSFKSSQSNQFGNNYESKDEMKYEEIGGGLAIGLRYFIHKNVSFGFETNMNYANFNRKVKNTQTNTGLAPQTYSNNYKDEGSVMAIEPFSVLSVNVHF